MNPFGTFSLLDADRKGVKCWISWIKDYRDWSFVQEWQKQSVNLSNQQVMDSVDYAETGAKRWRWLRQQRMCVTDIADGLHRIRRNPGVEFGFALALSMKENRKRRLIGFCYARRLWLNRLCLEFLGANPPPGMRNTGSLLLYAVADVSRTFGIVEVWGECTAESRTFYQKAKARLLVSALQDSLAQNKRPNYPRGWQLPGALDDRFVFGRHELALMSDALRAREVR